MKPDLHAVINTDKIAKKKTKNFATFSEKLKVHLKYNLIGASFTGNCQIPKNYNEAFEREKAVFDAWLERNKLVVTDMFLQPIYVAFYDDFGEKIYIPDAVVITEEFVYIVEIKLSKTYRIKMEKELQMYKEVLELVYPDKVVVKVGLYET